VCSLQSKTSAVSLRILFICDWSWPHYLGNEIKLLLGRPSLVTERRITRKFDRGSRLRQQRHLAFGLPLHVLISSWRYRPRIFMWGDGLRKLLKFNQYRYGRFRENRHFMFHVRFEGPIFFYFECSDLLGTVLWRITIQCRIWINSVHHIDL
jgi:hypothetical protein